MNDSFSSRLNIISFNNKLIYRFTSLTCSLTPFPRVRRCGACRPWWRWRRSRGWRCPATRPPRPRPPAGSAPPPTTSTSSAPGKSSHPRTGTSKPPLISQRSIEESYTQYIRYNSYKYLNENRRGCLLVLNSNLHFLAVDNFNISHNSFTDNSHILTVFHHYVFAFAFNNKSGIFALNENETIVWLDLFFPRILNDFFSVVFLS